MQLTKEELLGVIARGWCHEKNASKTMDSDLAVAIADELLALNVPKPVKLEEIEQYRMQMAGISTAALGYWKESDAIHADYDTVPLRDVAKLYSKYDALFRAQADARPVAWTNAKELEGVKNVGEGYARAIWGAKNPNFATIALYTHPEASAPWLSEDEIQAIEHAIQRLDFRRAPEKFLDRLRAIITRASAATVAEPSESEEPLVEEEKQSYRTEDGIPTERVVLEREWRQMRDALASKKAVEPTLFRWATSWAGDWTYRTERPAGWKNLLCFEAYALCPQEQAAQQQAEPPHCYAFKTCASPAVCGKAGHCVNTFDESQQAEPGADERAAWFAVVMEAAAALENVSYCTRDEDAKHQVIGAATYARERAKVLLAAQSGQRAGVPKADELYRIACEFAKHQGYADPMLAIAAAPTQQQEGGE